MGDPPGEHPWARRHRHSSTADGLLLLACDLADPSVRFDASWWDPIGMRGTVSYLVRVRSAHSSRKRIKSAKRDNTSTRVGSRGSAPTTAQPSSAEPRPPTNMRLDYIRVQNKASDPYVQHRVATMALNLESAHLWLRRVAELWEAGRQSEARSAGNRARYLLEMWATDTVEQALHACGAPG